MPVQRALAALGSDDDDSRPLVGTKRCRARASPSTEVDEESSEEESSERAVSKKPAARKVSKKPAARKVVKKPAAQDNCTRHIEYTTPVNTY